MTHRCIATAIMALLMAATANAQSYRALRDSLSEVMEALEFHPDSVDLHLRKAGLNIELEQWKYALDEYDLVLERLPDNPAALFYRAYVNDKLGRYDFARADYESLLRVAPMHFEGQLGLALLNEKDNHYTEALNQMGMMAELFPDSAIVYAVRAGMEQERKMMELADFDYGKAIELDPANTDYRLSRANLRIVMRRKQDARDDLDALVRMGVSRANLKPYYDKCK